MSYQITDANGVTSLRPDHHEMVRIVKEMLELGEDDFAEATMTISDGTSLSLHSNGSAALDIPDSSSYSILIDLSLEEQIMLWVQLAAGNLVSIQKLDWQNNAT